MAADCNGIGGQNLDLALLLADVSAQERAGPFEARSGHIPSISGLFQYIWGRRLSTDELLLLAVGAKVKLTKATRPWSVCTGPASAFIATFAKSVWTIADALGGCNDICEKTDFVKGPPFVIKKMCDELVRRWRWRRIGQALPSANLGDKGVGACTEPKWKLLSKSRLSGDQQKNAGA